MVLTTTSMTAVSVSMRSAQLAVKRAGIHPAQHFDFRVMALMEEAEEHDPGQDGGNAEQARGEIHGPGRAIIMAVVVVMGVIGMGRMGACDRHRHRHRGPGCWNSLVPASPAMSAPIRGRKTMA